MVKKHNTKIMLIYFYSQLSYKLLSLKFADKVFVDDKEMLWNNILHNEN